MGPAPALHAAVLAALELTSEPCEWGGGGSSSLNATWRLSCRGRAWFVKAHAASGRAMLEAEAHGLRALAAAGAVRVPAPLAVGGTAQHAFLVLEWLPIGRGGRDAKLGRALARLHAFLHTRFGFERDNTIGTTAQRNAWSDDWAAFFRDERLAPQLALAAARSAEGRSIARVGERLLACVPALLRGHAPGASLLHGDLWSGNAGATPDGEPVIFDPAAYYGDREADLAMTELFGGFGADFDAAYREAAPLPPGYPVRRELYNLYHVLNHFHLFGGGYGRQAGGMIGRLLAEAD